MKTMDLNCDMGESFGAYTLHSLLLDPPPNIVRAIGLYSDRKFSFRRLTSFNDRTTGNRTLLRAPVVSAISLPPPFQNPTDWFVFFLIHSRYR